MTDRTDDRAMVVRTSSFWQALATPGVVPVRVSLGTPKGIAVPALEPAIPPYSLLAIWESDPDGYRRRYRHQLHRRRAHVLAALQDLHETYLAPLVLCCYEAEPSDCHRSLLAQWLTENGVEVDAR